MKTNKQQKYPSHSWEWVKYQLGLKGYTFGKLAKIHKVKKTNFTNVKNVCSPKYQQLIADYIGVKPWNLWPDRYKNFLEYTSKEINTKDFREKDG